MPEPQLKMTRELIEGDRIIVNLPGYFGGTTITGIQTLTRSGDRQIRTTAGEITSSSMSLWTICDEEPPPEAPPPEFPKKRERDPRARRSVD